MADAQTTKKSDGWFIDHDLLVMVGAIVLLIGGWFAYTAMTRPKSTSFDRQGLTFSHPSAWLPTDPNPEAFPNEATFTALTDASTRVEVRITKKPAFDGPLGSVLDFNRSHKYGELYKRLATGDKTVNGKQWARTEFVYAYKATEDDAPEVVHAVEYGIVNNDKLYVVTVHGPGDQVRSLERDILGTLALK